MLRSLLVPLLLVSALCSFAQAEDYVIGDGDVLKIGVWGVAELSGMVTVRPDGKITLPAAGDVEASGVTPSVLSERLATVLEKFVQKAIVTVSVEQIHNNKIFISGGGVPARVLALPGRTSLFRLLCSLDGIEKTDLANAYLLRGTERLLNDFRPLFVDGDLTKDVELKADDVLFIPNNERNKIYVVGAVKQPKYIFHRDGLKVLDAILESGGFNDYAKENSVIIFRGQGEKITAKIKKLQAGDDLGQNVALQPGDFVIVPEGIF